jgi:Tfp pilus assembly protein PilV
LLTGHCNKDGFGIIDSLMALFMLTIGVLAMLSMLPQGWSSATSSDNRSRASQILQAELQNAESLIMNPCNLLPATPFFTNPNPKTIYASGNTAPIANSGDVPFTVTTQVTQPVSASQWQVTTTVIWPGTTTGVSATVTVMQQEDYRYWATAVPPNSCANGSFPVNQSAF